MPILLAHIITAALVWPTSLTSAAGRSSSRVRSIDGGRSSSSHTSLANSGILRGNIVLANRKKPRQLSAEDQLDILRLGFIPTNKSWDEDESSSSTPRRSDGMFNRGGGMEPPSRQLSAEDQLDILRLGFIPTTKSWDDKCSSTPRRRSNGMRTTHFNRGGSMEPPSVAKESRRTIPPLAFASIMALLAGYSDVICYQKFQCYAAMMSGNVVTMSIAMAEREWMAVLWKLSLIGSYFVGAASVRSIELLCQRRGRSMESKKGTKDHLKIIAPIIAAVFAIADKKLLQSASSEAHMIWSLAALAFGYGMVYASANQALNATITQLLTGHITKLGSAVSDRILGSTGRWNKGSLTSVCILGSFIIGGTLGLQMFQMVPKDFPLFSLLGIVYALALTMF